MRLGSPLKVLEQIDREKGRLSPNAKIRGACDLRAHLFELDPGARRDPRFASRLDHATESHRRVYVGSDFCRPLGNVVP